MDREFYTNDFSGNRQEALVRIREKLTAHENRTGKLLKSLKSPKRGNICQSFWGKEWCRHLQTFSYWDYALPRGRRLLRGENVYDLSIEKGKIHGFVAEDDLYEVTIHLDLVDDEFKEALISMAEQSAVSLLDLWEGKLSNELLEQLTCREHSLFPVLGELKSICTCSDWADLCPHGAAALYGSALLFEQNPELLFVLRGLFKEELLKIPETFQDISTIRGNDLAGIFGIEILPD